MTTLADISPTGGGWDSLKAWSWTKNAVKFADEIGPLILAALRREAPVSQGTPDSGRLRDAIRYRRETAIGNLVMIFDVPNVPYFPYVIHGTQGGQLIQPVAARALHWMSDGQDVFAKSVIRGATPANDFPERVWRMMSESIQAAFMRAMKRL